MFHFSVMFKFIREKYLHFQYRVFVSLPGWCHPGRHAPSVSSYSDAIALLVVFMLAILLLLWYK